jgi:hypothetical protein
MGRRPLAARPSRDTLSLGYAGCWWCPTLCPKVPPPGALPWSRGERQRGPGGDTVLRPHVPAESSGLLRALPAHVLRPACPPSLGGGGLDRVRLVLRGAGPEKTTAARRSTSASAEGRSSLIAFTAGRRWTRLWERRAALPGGAIPAEGLSAALVGSGSPNPTVLAVWLATHAGQLSVSSAGVHTFHQPASCASLATANPMVDKLTAVVVYARWQSGAWATSQTRVVVARIVTLAGYYGRGGRGRDGAAPPSHPFSACYACGVPDRWGGQAL